MLEFLNQMTSFFTLALILSATVVSADKTVSSRASVQPTTTTEAPASLNQELNPLLFFLGGIVIGIFFVCVAGCTYWYFLKLDQEGVTLTVNNWWKGIGQSVTLEVGDRVKLVGLESKAHEGLFGTLLEVVKSKHQWKVKLDGLDKQEFIVGRNNLVKLSKADLEDPIHVENPSSPFNQAIMRYAMHGCAP